MMTDELLLKYLLLVWGTPFQRGGFNYTYAVLVMPQLSLSIQNPLLMPEEALLVHNWVLITRHYDT